MSQPSSTQTSKKRKSNREQQSSSHQACSACKTRKVRCDAKRPRCSYCSARNKDCTYPQVYKRALCSQLHVEALEAKLRNYEKTFGTSEGVRAGASAISPPASEEDPRHGDPRESRSSHNVVNLVHDSQQEFNASSNQLGTSLVYPEQFALPNSFFETACDNEVETNVRHRSSGPMDALLEAQEPCLEQPPPSDGQAGVAESGCASPAEIDESDEGEHGDGIPATDGMVQYASQSPQPRAPEGFFGDSSTFHFAMNVRASAMGGGKTQTSGNPGGPNAASNYHAEYHDPRERERQLQAQSELQQEDEEDLSALKSYLTASSLHYLPQRHVAKALLERYFMAVHPVWPFLLEDATRSQFDRTWASDEPPSPIWMAQLNLIFSLGCQFYETDLDKSTPVDDVYEAGRQFYQRGRSFVVANAFNTCNIGMLQALLLMAQYQQGTMKANQCWLTIGHATRMAQGLGLHVSQPAHYPVPPAEQELHKRLWWGCFSLDRVASMIYGRPIGIPHMHMSKNQQNLPLATDDKYIALGQEQPEAQPSINAFFRGTVRLYYVMDEILEILHETTAGVRSSSRDSVDPGGGAQNQFSGPTALHLLTKIIQLDGKLLSWHDSLPDSLKFSIDSLEPNEERALWLRRQKHILKIRFLGMRILLHRQTLLFLLQPLETRIWPQKMLHQRPPLFPNVSRDKATPSPAPLRQNGSHSSFEDAIAHLSASICVSSAALQVESIDACRPQRLSGAWWWDLFFTFNSLCVLIGALGLQRKALAAVIPDLPRTKNLIQRGFQNIQIVAPRGGVRVHQSEKFLRRLMRATVRRAKQEPVKKPDLPMGDTHVLPDPSASRRPGQSFENEPPIGESISSQNGQYPLLGPPRDTTDGNGFPSAFGWSPDINNFLSSWVVEDGDERGSNTGSASDLNNIGNLLHSSFDLWSAFDGSIPQSDGKKFQGSQQAMPSFW